MPPWAFLCGCCMCRAGSMGCGPCGSGRGGGTRCAPANPSAFPQLAPRGPACPISSPKGLSSDTNETRALLRFWVQGAPRANGLLGRVGVTTDSPGCSSPAREDVKGRRKPLPTEASRPRVCAGRGGHMAQSGWPGSPQPQTATWHLAGHRPPPPTLCVWAVGTGAVRQCSPSCR